MVSAKESTEEDLGACEYWGFKLLLPADITGEDKVDKQIKIDERFWQLAEVSLHEKDIFDDDYSWDTAKARVLLVTI